VSRRPPVSCLVYTLNEEVNLPHCLSSLEWCNDIVVVDSYSSDRTEAIARAAGALFVQHEFTGFGDQRNWSFDQMALGNPWALILDADERVPSGLITEMGERLPEIPNDVGAFRLRRRFHLWGKWLRYSSLYPTWVVRLIRVGRVRYLNRGHGETQEVNGRIESLANDLIDENRKGLEAWWDRHNHYSTREARYELAQSKTPLISLVSCDPLRRRAAVKRIARDLPGRPCWFFLYSYLLRLGFLDGREGLRFCLMKAMYQAMIELKKHELRSSKSPQALDDVREVKERDGCLPMRAKAVEACSPPEFLGV
jgi:glycosyltransferase involved in cell wall biosynthesis